MFHAFTPDLRSRFGGELLRAIVTTRHVVNAADEAGARPS
jgi:hypothetical protein